MKLLSPNVVGLLFYLLKNNQVGTNVFGSSADVA
jgi:hypothetical protein